MVKWYKDGTKAIRPELLDGEAQNQAKKWAVSKDRNNEPVFTTTQLRRYYGEAKNLERQMQVLAANANAWDSVYPLVKMLKSKVSYDMRKDNKIPQQFKEFIFESVDSIKEEADFRAFLKYFEASVGFYYGEGKGKA
ncbi:MAG TPA: type III-A CRISPR-associated protein Csm2 [Leptospiraceae bacterium]|jgi:CRISPR type III-A-associated protein Csm2|nr:type III-A CRISPR-associated protein Csm2 [Leptospiraceae bacterium]